MNDFGTYEEKDLLYKLQSGNVTAFTTIYNQHWKKMFYLAGNKLQNLAEAEELVQDIFLDLWRRREELKITGSLSSYLSACVKYKVINVLAKRNQQERYSLYSSHQSRLLADNTTEERLRLEELQHELMNETEKLPAKCKMVFRLSREQGYSQKQIATRMGISEKTVESHLSKALRTLRIGLSQFISFIFLHLLLA
jgi:RNA polymerase sigma-70 factor (ECF subfamily)